MAREIEGGIQLNPGLVLFRGLSAPAVSPAGGAALWWDRSNGLLKLSLSGGAYAEIANLGSGALTAAKMLTALASASIVSAHLAPTTIQYAAVEVTSAQLLALFTTPKTLVAAPGAGYVNQFCGALVAYDYGTTEYTINGSTNLAGQYTNGSGATASTTRATTGFIDQTADQMEIMPALATAVVPVDNAALVLTCATANPTLGNGTLHVKVAYRVLPTGL